MYQGDGEMKLIHASSSININSMFLGDCSQAFLLLPWFAKVGFLYPPPFPHGRLGSQNGRTILADGMIWCKYSAFPHSNTTVKGENSGMGRYTLSAA